MQLQIATSAHFYVPKRTVIPSVARDLLLRFTELLRNVLHPRDLLLRFTNASWKVGHSRSPYNIVQRLIHSHFMAEEINKIVRLDAI